MSWAWPSVGVLKVPIGLESSSMSNAITRKPDQNWVTESINKSDIQFTYLISDGTLSHLAIVKWTCGAFRCWIIYLWKYPQQMRIVVPASRGRPSTRTTIHFNAIMKIVSFIRLKSITSVYCVLTPTGILVSKGDAEVCGTSPCWGVISLQAAAGAPVGVPWMLGSTRINRKAVATAQGNTVDLWHDILLFDCELNWPVCPAPPSIYTSSNHIVRLYLSNKDWYKLAICVLVALLTLHAAGVKEMMGEMDFDVYSSHRPGHLLSNVVQ